MTPAVLFYRGKAVDEMSREELVRAVRELAGALDAERESARHEREVLGAQRTYRRLDRFWWALVGAGVAVIASHGWRGTGG